MSVCAHQPGVPVDGLERLVLYAVLGKVIKEVGAHLLSRDALLGKRRKVRLEPRLHRRRAAHEALEVEQEQRAYRGRVSGLACVCERLESVCVSCRAVSVALQCYVVSCCMLRWCGVV